MTEQELREKIIETLEKGGRNFLKSKETKVSIYEYYADALIAAGYGDVKEIKYRVRRAEKALYIACREMAEIIFKDDFDRHAQEYMYGYLKQAEKELAEENDGKKEV